MRGGGVDTIIFRIFLLCWMLCVPNPHHLLRLALYAAFLLPFVNVEASESGKTPQKKAQRKEVLHTHFSLNWRCHQSSIL